jgi:DNA-binding MarR family transcriptional regulator
VSSAKPSSEEAVAKALASATEMTGTEIATATGLGRSTVGKTLAALERDGVVRRHAGGRDGRRRLPDRWSIGHSKEPSPLAPSAPRLRPGQLEGLVLEYIDSQGADDTVGATAVAKALGRSVGAVGNCLSRLAAAGRVRQVSDKPRRYSSAASTSRKRGRASRPRKEGS